MPYTIWLKKNEEKRLLSGHGWVYANEAAKIEGKDKNGSLALVRAADGRFIGKGYINHASKILVRIFIRGGEEDGEELYERRIRAAWEYRKKARVRKLLPRRVRRSGRPARPHCG